MPDIRSKLQNPVVGYSVAGGVVLLALVIYFSGGSAAKRLGPPITMDYYLDLETGDLIEAKMGLVPPILSPSSGKPTAALARVFACNDCSDTNDRFVGFLMQYTPEGKRLKEDPKTIPPDLKPMMVSTSDGKAWFEEGSPDALKIMTDVNGKCPDGKLIPCKPAQQ